MRVVTVRPLEGEQHEAAYDPLAGDNGDCRLRPGCGSYDIGAGRRTEGLLQIHMPATKWATKAPPPLPTLMLATGRPPPRPRLDRMLIRTRRTGRRLVRHPIRTHVTRRGGSSPGPHAEHRGPDMVAATPRRPPVARPSKRFRAAFPKCGRRRSACGASDAARATRGRSACRPSDAGAAATATDRRGPSPAVSISPVQADPHAGHDTDAAGGHPRRTRDADLTRSGCPACGPPEPGEAPSTSPTDPHAGHAAPPAQPAPGPHAGHGAPPAQPATDPHAGHQMAPTAGPPVAPPPPEATSGPAHAADLVFGAEQMAGAREELHMTHGAHRFQKFMIDQLEVCATAPRATRGRTSSSGMAATSTSSG